MAYRKIVTRHQQRAIKHKEILRKSKDKRKQRKERKESGKPVGIPHTQESLRAHDETSTSRLDQDVIIEETHDELADIFDGKIVPKLILTHSDRACPKTLGFLKELVKIFPNSSFLPRLHRSLKDIIRMAFEHGYTSLLILNEDQKRINTLIISHLPCGPTATFRLTNVNSRRALRCIRHKGPVESGVIPHLITSRFQTRLGLRTERILSALFPNISRSPPSLHSRVCSFHNQRDYIFFRHYRYQHRKGESKDHLIMNEVGPRFTLKLKSIQLGTFDSQFGDYEWVRKRTEVGTSRRSFVI